MTARRQTHPTRAATGLESTAGAGPAASGGTPADSNPPFETETEDSGSTDKTESTGPKVASPPGDFDYTDAEGHTFSSSLTKIGETADIDQIEQLEGQVATIAAGD